MRSVTPPSLITQCPGASIWWLEDDRVLCKHVAPRLQVCGWRLVVFHRLPQLQAALQQDEPDLLLLDLRVPGEEDLSAIRDWRHQGLACPVLILSALANAAHRIEGLAAGANDYLAKPFHRAELAWRIEHQLLSSQPRRFRHHAMARPIPLGPLVLEPARCSLRRIDGEEFRLTRGDLALLLALLSQPNVVHPRHALLRASGSLVDAATSRSLDVRLSRLRRLLRSASAGAVGIASVRGRGYRLIFTPSEGSTAETLQTLGIGLLPIAQCLAQPRPFQASPSGLLLLALPLGLASVLCWLHTPRNRD